MSQPNTAAVAPGTAQHMEPGVASHTTDHWLTYKDVMRATGLSRATLYRMRKRGTFPQAFLIGGKVARWRASEVNQYLANPPAEARSRHSAA